MYHCPAKSILSALLCLLPFLALAQATPPSAGSDLTEPYDSVEIRWPKAEWFGKSRINLGSYATAKYKGGITSSSNRVLLNGQEESMQKTPVRVELMDSTGTEFKLQGKKYWTVGYWEEDGGGLSLVGELLNLPEVLTESETYIGDPVDIEIRDAEISQSLHPGEVWKFYLKRTRSTGAILQELDAYLSNGTRIIAIMGPVGPALSDTGPPGPQESYYDFMEDGKLIARASRLVPVVYFPAHTPVFTRSLLLTTIVAMGL